MAKDILKGFEQYVKVELGLSGATFLAYRRDVLEFLDFIGDESLSIPHIDEFIKSLRVRQLQSSTIRRKYMSIRCLCHHLISCNKLNANVVNTTQSVRVERKKPYVLEDHQVSNLLLVMESCPSSPRTINVRRNVAIILTLYHSGLRASELCGLDICDINSDRRELRVQGKGNRDRVVPTTRTCLDAIRDYVDFDRRTKTDAVFVQGNGSRITRRSVGGMLLSLSRRAGTELVTPHLLRRTCATQLVRRGMDMEFVRMILGHQHISTTQDYVAVDSKHLFNVHKICHPFGEKNGNSQ